MRQRAVEDAVGSAARVVVGEGRGGRLIGSGRRGERQAALQLHGYRGGRPAGGRGNRPARIGGEKRHESDVSGRDRDRGRDRDAERAPSPLMGSAARPGLGCSTRGVTLDAVMACLAGPAGTPVSLLVSRARDDPARPGPILRRRSAGPLFARLGSPDPSYPDLRVRSGGRSGPFAPAGGRDHSDRMTGIGSSGGRRRSSRRPAGRRAGCKHRAGGIPRPGRGGAAPPAPRGSFAAAVDSESIPSRRFRVVNSESIPSRGTPDSERPRRGARPDAGHCVMNALRLRSQSKRPLVLNIPSEVVKTINEQRSNFDNQS
jgi:hypothetical protein